MSYLRRISMRLDTAAGIQNGMELHDTITPTSDTHSPSAHHPGGGSGGATDPEAGNATNATVTPETAAATTKEDAANGRATVDYGWKPWSVVVGSFCLTISTYGLLSSIGLFQTYWQEHQLAEESGMNISWIISMFGFLDCFVAAPFGVLFDRYGSKPLLAIGCTVYLSSFVALAFATTYGQFMACFVIAGISAAVPTTVAFSVVSHWFQARQGLAIGIVTVGAAFGGIFFSLVLQAVFHNFTWKVSILILFGILFVLMTIANILIKTNLGPQQGSTEDFRGWMGCFKSFKFWLLCYCVFVYELVLFIQWGTIPAYSVLTGLGDQFKLMMVYNVGAIFGRSLPPWLADRRLGPLNTILAMNVFTLLVVIIVWFPFGDRSTTALFFVAALMGVGTGSFVPLSANCAGTFCEPEEIGTWLGCLYTTISFATLVGNPISQVLLENGGPKGLVAFLAALLGSSLLVGLILRWLRHGRKWAWGEKI